MKLRKDFLKRSLLRHRLPPCSRARANLESRHRLGEDFFQRAEVLHLVDVRLGGHHGMRQPRNHMKVGLAERRARGVRQDQQRLELGHAGGEASVQVAALREEGVVISMPSGLGVDVVEGAVFGKLGLVKGMRGTGGGGALRLETLLAGVDEVLVPAALLGVELGDAARAEEEDVGVDLRGVDEVDDLLGAVAVVVAVVAKHEGMRVGAERVEVAQDVDARGQRRGQRWCRERRDGAVGVDGEVGRGEVVGVACVFLLEGKRVKARIWGNYTEIDFLDIVVGAWGEALFGQGEMRDAGPLGADKGVYLHLQGLLACASVHGGWMPRHTFDIVDGRV